jgi:small neutral amino acid transporter SnatA (MarC family)
MLNTWQVLDSTQRLRISLRATDIKAILLPIRLFSSLVFFALLQLSVELFRDAGASLKDCDETRDREDNEVND